MGTEAGPLAWIASERRRQNFGVADIALVDSQEWVIVDGVVRHNTGRFFEIHGLEWTDPTGSGVSAPFVNQPEVGILGIAVKQRDDGLLVLLDAKFEPGNVHGVDVAPSFQATKSNFEKAHGGAAPALSELFLTSSNWHSNVRQSEQGTRFVKKWNDNVIVRVDEDWDIAPTMRWCTLEDLRVILQTSHTLNTDARSVIATSDWNLWKSPTVRHAESEKVRMAHALRETLAEPIRSDLKEFVTHVLADWQDRHEFFSRAVALSTNEGRMRVESQYVSAGIAMSHLLVTTDSRERSHWDQPLISNPESSEEILLCAFDDEDVPRFFFTPTTEVGLADAQFGNSASTPDPGRAHPLKISDPAFVSLLRESTTLSSITQSDEGGRFNRQLVTYTLAQIKNIGLASEIESMGVWLSAAEVSQLARQSGFFTNEARTAISLIVGAL